MKRVLFVDDQPELLDGLKRMLRGHRTKWEMSFVTSGAAALACMQEKPFDVIVSDMRMPEMDGAMLLEEVMRRSPQTVRIMLSGHADEEQILRAAGPTHQFLSKPCAPEALTETIERACMIRDLFKDLSVQSMVSRATKLPTIPRIYQRLVQAFQSPEVSVKMVGELISQDLAISCQLLHLVNSGFFCLSRRVENPVHAASLLGLDRLRTLVLSAGIFCQFDGKMPPGLSLDGLMEHSLATSVAAQRLIELEHPGETGMANDAALAGIVHDVGFLIMLQNRCRDYEVLLDAARSQLIHSFDAELRQFHTCHDQLGAYLMGLWGLPKQVVEAVALHHRPRESPERTFNVLASVHVANALVHERLSLEKWPFSSTLDLTYVQEIGVEHRLKDWREQIHTLFPEAKS